MPKFWSCNVTKEIEYKFSNPFVFATWRCKHLIFQIKIIWSNIIHSLKYLRSTTLGCEDIWNRKSELVAKTQFISKMQVNNCIYIILCLKTSNCKLWYMSIFSTAQCTIYILTLQSSFETVIFRSLVSKVKLLNRCYPRKI